MGRTNPCWPTCLGEGRTAGCHATCPKYIQHEKERFEKERIREREFLEKMDVEQHITDTINRFKRGNKK